MQTETLVSTTRVEPPETFDDYVERKRRARKARPLLGHSRRGVKRGNTSASSHVSERTRHSRQISLLTPTPIGWSHSWPTTARHDTALCCATSLAKAKSRIAGEFSTSRWRRANDPHGGVATSSEDLLRHFCQTRRCQLHLIVAGKSSNHSKSSGKLTTKNAHKERTIFLATFRTQETGHTNKKALSRRFQDAKKP